VRDHDLSRFTVGSKVEFTADGDHLARLTGRIIWVAPYLDPDTRTGLVRATVASGPAVPRAHTFGWVRPAADTAETVLLIPKDAVQWEGCCHVVFVQEAADRFRPRKVTIDRADREHYLVAAGLSAGEVVVTRGSYLLKSELNKESLGVGCAGE